MQNAHVLAGSTILVVEDNPDTLEATDYLIEAAFGCEVLSASSYKEALTLIEQAKKIDLIFCDVVLADSDGVALARAARERLPDVPIVLVTGWQSEIDSIIERGHVALLKPYAVDQLEAVLVELICKRQLGSESTKFEATQPATRLA